MNHCSVYFQFSCCMVFCWTHSACCYQTAKAGTLCVYNSQWTIRSQEYKDCTRYFGEYNYASWLPMTHNILQSAMQTWVHHLTSARWRHLTFAGTAWAWIHFKRDAIKRHPSFSWKNERQANTCSVTDIIYRHPKEARMQNGGTNDPRRAPPSTTPVCRTIFRFLPSNNRQSEIESRLNRSIASRSLPGLATASRCLGSCWEKRSFDCRGWNFRWPRWRSDSRGWCCSGCEERSNEATVSVVCWSMVRWTNGCGGPFN